LNWNNLAQNKNHLWDLVNTVMNVWVTQEVATLLVNHQTWEWELY